MWIGACKGFSYGFRDFHPSIAKFVVFVWHSWLCVSFADLGQTSRTISGVDRVREQGPSRTPSPSVGSFQDMAARRPRQDVPMVHRVTLPTVPLPHSQRGATHAIRDPTVPQKHVHVVHNDSIIPETEVDATSDELQILERRTKSRNDQQWEEKLTCGDEEVNGRLKRKNANNVFSHRRGMCASPCKMWTSLRNGELVDPVPGGVLNHRPPPILRVWLLISPLTMMAKERNPKRILMKHMSFQSSVVGGRNPRLIVSYERPRPKLTARTQVSGRGRRGRLLPRGAFLPRPGLPSEEGLREREILGLTLL